MFLVLFFAGVVGYGFFVGHSRSSTTTVKTEGYVQGPGTFAFDIVGEASYQQHLERIAGGRSYDSAQIRAKAMLVLEDNNRHDCNAVCVVIDGLRVGYLDRASAKAWRRALFAKRYPMGHYFADAMIVGGWDRGGGDRGHFGVKMDIPFLE